MTPDQLTIVAIALLGGGVVIGGLNYLWARIDRNRLTSISPDNRTD